MDDYNAICGPNCLHRSLTVWVGFEDAGLAARDGNIDSCRPLLISNMTNSLCGDPVPPVTNAPSKALQRLYQIKRTRGIAMFQFR